MINQHEEINCEQTTTHIGTQRTPSYLKWSVPVPGCISREVLLAVLAEWWTKTITLECSL